MGTLFVEKSVDIRASASTVWRVLTDPDLTEQWIAEFGMDGHIESVWKIGTPVLWKDDSGEIIVRGNVIALEPSRFLHFTVIDVESGPSPGMDETDGITFVLNERNGVTALSVTHGDFAKDPNGERYYRATLPIWDRALPKIKELAENEEGQG